jgi:ketosteroid isomerase-like protein
METDRFVDAGAPVVAVGTVPGIGGGSGADVRVPIAFVCTLEDGKIVRVEEYLNPSEALAAVGLEG